MSTNLVIAASWSLFIGEDKVMIFMVANDLRVLEASNELKISKATFYRLVKRYRQS